MSKIDEIKQAFIADPLKLISYLNIEYDKTRSLSGYLRFYNKGEIKRLSVNEKSGYITDTETDDKAVSCVDYVMQKQGLNLQEACEFLGSIYSINTNNTININNTKFIINTEKKELKDCVNVKVWAGFSEAEIMQDIKQSENIKLTPAEMYLNARNCYFESVDLRYAELYDSDTKQKEPCLIGIIRAYEDYSNILGIQRIYLTEFLKTGKSTGLKKRLKLIENKKGIYGVIFLSKDSLVGICEGIEDGLTLTKLGYPTLCCINAGNLAKFPYDKELKKLFVFVDNDVAGLRAFESVNNRYYLHGGDVFRVDPPNNKKDFNEYIRSLE